MEAALQELRDALPDVPRWLETRALLAQPSAELFMSQNGFVVRSARAKLAAAIGEPDDGALTAALTGADPGWSLLAAPEDADHVGKMLGSFRRERASLYVMSGPTPRLDEPDPGLVDLTRSDLARLPAALAEELARVVDRTDVVAIEADGVIASVAYVPWETERLYDVSVDTLGPHRRKGYGERAVRGLLDRRDEVKRPVWGAVESNLASQKLAARLGFRPFDEMFVFTLPPSDGPVN